MTACSSLSVSYLSIYLSIYLAIYFVRSKKPGKSIIHSFDTFLPFLPYVSFHIENPLHTHEQNKGILPYA